MSLCWPYLLPSSLLTPVIECWILDPQATTYTHHTLAHIHTQTNTHITHILPKLRLMAGSHITHEELGKREYLVMTQFVINLIKFLQLKFHICICVCTFINVIFIKCVINTVKSYFCLMSIVDYL